MSNLASLGEFGFINRFTKAFDTLTPSYALGVGDDCAILDCRLPMQQLVSTDLLVEGQHFLLKHVHPFDLGYKSLAVNISDIAAMGGRPTAFFLSLALPGSLDVAWCQAFFDGLFFLAQRHHLPLLGGDTTASKQGLVINITILGEAPKENIKRRSGANVGDAILVTGPLGNAAAGLELILSQAKHPESEWLIQQHYRPIPQALKGRWLGSQTAVSAMMDISDGIASDLPKILDASGVGAEVYVDKLPISQPMLSLAKQQGKSWESFALSGGEDYQLLLTCKSAYVQALRSELLAYSGEQLFEIGRILSPEQGLQYFKFGKALRETTKPFGHFG